jgi:hypothetical protein
MDREVLIADPFSVRHDDGTLMGCQTGDIHTMHPRRRKFQRFSD